MHRRTWMLHRDPFRILPALSSVAGFRNEGCHGSGHQRPEVSTPTPYGSRAGARPRACDRAKCPGGFYLPGKRLQSHSPRGAEPSRAAQRHELRGARPGSSAGERSGAGRGGGRRSHLSPAGLSWPARRGAFRTRLTFALLPLRPEGWKLRAEIIRGGRQRRGGVCSDMK